jgi:hypothetical protein
MTPGVRFLRAEEAAAIYALDSGTHRFVVPGR